MGNKVQAIVRGPEPYFGEDASLYAPGEIVLVDEDFVSTKDNFEEEIEVETKNGNMRKQTILRRVKFRPIGSEATVGESLDPAQVATANPDRLNVTDFLKGGTDEIVASISNGNVDDHLGVIEQAELTREGPARAAVKAAIAARQASLNG